MDFFCRDCRVADSELPPQTTSSIPRRRQPLKMRLLHSLGLLQPLIRRYVLSKARTEYQFSRRHLQFLERDGSSVPIVHFPLTNPSRSTLIVYSHGNGSDLNNVYHLARRLYELYGVAVVAYDYTGYGESRQERGSFEEDIRTVLAWVVSKGYHPGRIVLAGFSLGSYPTLLLDSIIMLSSAHLSPRKTNRQSLLARVRVQGQCPIGVCRCS